VGRASETFGRWRDPWFGDPVTGMWNVEPLDEESGDPSTENAGVLGNEIATLRHVNLRPEDPGTRDLERGFGAFGQRITGQGIRGLI